MKGRSAIPAETPLRPSRKRELKRHWASHVCAFEEAEIWAPGMLVLREKDSGQWSLFAAAPSSLFFLEETKQEYYGQNAQRKWVGTRLV